MYRMPLAYSKKRLAMGKRKNRGNEATVWDCGQYFFRQLDFSDERDGVQLLDVIQADLLVNLSRLLDLCKMKPEKTGENRLLILDLL